jgi:hypothetical protein
VEAGEPPRHSAASFGRAAAPGRDMARWCGRGDEQLGFSLIALAFGAAYLIVLAGPWVESVPGWGVRVGEDSGLIALALVLVELARLGGGWISPAAGLWAISLNTAAAIMGLATWLSLRWGSGPFPGTGLAYGAWLGLVFALLLLVLAVLRWIVAFEKPAP